MQFLRVERIVRLVKLDQLSLCGKEVGKLAPPSLWGNVAADGTQESMGHRCDRGAHKRRRKGHPAIERLRARDVAKALVSAEQFVAARSGQCDRDPCVAHRTANEERVD